MPEEQQKIEVDSTDQVRGKIVFGKAAIWLPTPSILSTAISWIKNTCIGLSTLFLGSDLFNPHETKVICFILGAITILAGGTKLGVGVDNSKKN